MTRTLFILCAFDDKEAKEFLSGLEEAYVKSLDTSFQSQVFTNLQKTLMEKAGVSFLTGVKNDWYNEVKAEYIQEVQRIIKNKIETSISDYYIYTPLNFFYINLWRRIGQRLNLEIKFLINWSSFDFNNSENLRFKYHATYMLLKDSLYDCYYFNNRDFSLHFNTSTKCLKSILNKENIFSNFTPIELLAQELEESPTSNLEVPVEIKTLLNIINNLRFGTQYCNDYKEDNENWELLENSLGTKSGLYFWFDLVSKIKLETNILNENYRRNEDTDEMIQAFKFQYQKLRNDNKIFRSRIEELTSLQDKAVVPKASRPNKAPQKINKATPKITEEEVKKRKQSKFKRDPYTFFNDSKRVYIRPLRFFYKKNV